jgi:mannose-1-phosphate guanylyltransferase/phosphomannomutase
VFRENYINRGGVRLSMKAMILAAGLGTRLRPITDTVPKCMIPVANKPLIEHQIVWLKEHGITDIMINLHYLSEKITDYLGDGSKFGVKLHYSFEPELMGTAGGVKKVESFFDDTFVVYYGDEITNYPLSEHIKAHTSSNALMTLLTAIRPTDQKWSTVITTDDTNRITKFIEKPSNEQIKEYSVNRENCGVLVCDKKVLSLIPHNTFFDFSRDVLENITSTHLVHSYQIPDNAWWYELGTVERYMAHKPTVESHLSKNTLTK